MKTLTVIILVLTLLTPAIGQRKKCDNLVLTQTHAKLEKLTSNDIRIFLSVFDPSCKNNVEFAEFSNELLFSVLEKHTKKTLLILEKNYPEIQLNTILNVLEYSLTDAVDLNYLIQKVEKVSVSDPLKKQVVYALQVSNNQ